MLPTFNSAEADVTGRSHLITKRAANRTSLEPAERFASNSAKFRDELIQSNCYAEISIYSESGGPYFMSSNPSDASVGFSLSWAGKRELGC